MVLTSADCTKCVITVAGFLTLMVSAFLGIDSFIHVAVGLVLGAVWGIQIAQRFSPPPSLAPAQSHGSPSGSASSPDPQAF